MNSILAFPASSGQERIWFLEQLQNENSAYNVPLVIKIKGDLNVEALANSLVDIVNRHESLRTNFEEIDNVLCQVISPDNRFELKIIDLSESNVKGEREIKDIAANEIKRKFDLLRDCLIRVTLIKVDTREYVLVLSAHHIIFDGWSAGVLLQELKTLYYNHTHDDQKSLPELPIQYADFSVWQNEWLNSEECKEQMAYWKNKLSGDLSPTELPTDKPRPAIQTYNGAKKLITIKHGTYNRLKELARNENCTIFMMVLTVLKILIYRYTGKEDILVGSPFANRNNSELEHQIGIFINTVVLRTNLATDRSFREVLSMVRQTTLEAHTNQNLPFGRIIDELMPERDVSRNPIFQVMLQIFPSFPLKFNKLDVEPVHVDNDTAQVDLALHLWDSGKELSGFFEYNTDLFHSSTIDQLEGHFHTILESILEGPDGKISTLNILTNAEYQQLIIDWNNTRVNHPSEQTFIKLFEDQALKTPDAIAVDFDNKLLTYKELNQKANQLGHYLQSLGVGREVLVGICVERSLDMVVGLLGIFKAGGAYVPMDPAFPKDRLNFMLEDAGISFLVTQEKLLGIFPGYSGRSICLDSDWNTIRKEQVEAPIVALKPGHLAYVIYTSGSTGKPKGVEVEHRALINFLCSMKQKPGLNPDDILLSVTTLSFDIAALELYLPLMTGARLVLVDRKTILDGTLLLNRIKSSKATVMQATPSTWRLLLEAGWEGPLNLKMLCGGEALPRDLANKLLALGSSLWNMYGPTETTIWSSVNEVTDREGPVLIGPPIANTQLYILDHKLQPVPVGVSGELHIGGAGLARGYLNRPELSNERFIPDPFGMEKTSRLYKTGDLVRYRPDGNIEFLGRIDHQVKIRGFRIELGEIENTLSTHPSVRQDIVIDREDASGDRKLVAYVVPEAGQLLDTGVLRAHLQKKLPGYMIPSWFVGLDQLPMTPNGKIDRKALPKPEIKTNHTEGYTEGARDELELQLAIIWKKILGVKSISIHDNFFETGGHSLLAAKLFVKIEKSFGKKLPLAILFQAPTIAQIADILRKENWKPTWSSLVAIQPGGTRPPLFLAHGAEGNVLLYRQLVNHLGPDQPVYGLQSYGLNGEDFHENIPDMAAHYIREMRMLQPHGPYYLGGYCMGGAIALEIAQQLNRENEEVAVLAMFETYNFHATPNFLSSYYNYIIYRLQNIKYHFDNLLLLKPKDQWRFFLDKFKVEKGRISLKVSAELSKLSKKLNISRNGHSYPHLKATKINDQAVIDYLPQKYPGRIILFKPGKMFKGANDPQFGWGSIASDGVEAYKLTVNPRGMLMEPFVKELADQLKNVIDNTIKEEKKVYNSIQYLNE